MKKVYIAGPYTGDQAANVGTALMYAEGVAELGAVPYVPHLTHFWHMMFRHDYDWWLWYDFQWLDCCDAPLRSPVGSKAKAPSRNGCGRALSRKPVFKSVGELEAWLQKVNADAE